MLCAFVRLPFPGPEAHFFIQRCMPKVVCARNPSRDAHSENSTEATRAVAVGDCVRDRVPYGTMAHSHPSSPGPRSSRTSVGPCIGYCAVPSVDFRAPPRSA